VQPSYIPVKELWLKHSSQEIAVVLNGFIDESYDHAKVPKVFSMSCTVTSVAGWCYLEIDWLKLLARKNEELKKQGRKEISRFHAAPFNNFKGEFKDWTPDEQKEFSREIVEVFNRNPVHTHGYCMPLQLLVQEFPETKPNPIGFAYITLLTRLMQQIGETTLALYPRDVISLHHDHCDYDAALQEQFGSLLEDSSFKYRNRFTSLTAEHSQHCALLQPADFVAYENFKEAMREYSKRNRRQSLERLLSLDAVSGRLKGFTVDGIRELKSNIDRLSVKAKKILFATVGIPYVNDAEKFDTTVRKILSVSHDELKRREKEWKRKRAKKKRVRKPASRAPRA